MPSISSCPECHRDLTIPDVADPQQLLGCPLCDARFTADRILAESVSFPPTAIIIDDRVSAGTVAEPQPEPEHFDDELAPAGEPTTEKGDIAEAAIADDDLAAVASNKPDADIEQPASDFDSFGQQAATMRVAPKARRKTSMLGVVGQLLGMALGGVAGLAIGYYVLIWLGGPRADFLHVLPKVPHWLRPPARRHNDAGSSLPLAEQPSEDMEPFEPPHPSETSEDAVTSKSEDVEPSGPTAELASFQAATVPEPEPTAALQTPPPALAVEPLPQTAKPLPESYRGPRGFRLRTASELKAALIGAEHALRCPHCQRPGAVPLAAFRALDGDDEQEIRQAGRCDFCRGKPVLNLTADSYERLCDLAEAVTFARFDGDDTQREQCRDAAVALLMVLGGHREKSDVVGRLSGARLEDSQRQSNGILLAGVVQQTRQQGDLFTIQLLLLGSGKTVTVVGRESPEPPLAGRDRLLVLGSIVDSPRDNLAGYTGDLPQVVWGGLPLKLAAPAR